MIDASHEVSPLTGIRAGCYFGEAEAGFRADTGYPAIDLGIRGGAVSDTESWVVRQFEQLHLLATASHSPPPFCPSLSPTSAGRQRTGKT